MPGIEPEACPKTCSDARAGRVAAWGTSTRDIKTKDGHVYDLVGGLEHEFTDGIYLLMAI